MPRRSSGKVWLWLGLIAVVGGVLALIALVQLGSAMGNLAQGPRFTRQLKHHLHEITVEDNDSRNKIAVIDVDGIITSQDLGRGRNMVEHIQDCLERAADDDAVKAVILKVDSPGGEVLASDDIARAISSFQETTDKPVISSMGALAASGGYYVSAPCRWIVANELTITGSIGVIMHSFNFRGLLDKVGVAPQVFKSGKFKDMLSGTKELSEIDPKEREMIQSMIDETFTKFKSVVAAGRKEAADANKGEGRELAADWADYADGRVLTGRQAQQLGFVDELGNFDTSVARARTLAGIESANLIRYHEPFDVARFFSLFGKSDAAQLKIDLGVDFNKIQAGRLYFLSPTYLH